MTNTSDRPMPGGLGWHPYFPRADATPEISATAIWRSACADLALVPTPLDPACDVRGPVPVDHVPVDHAFDVPDGPAAISWPASQRSLRIQADSPLRHTIVYTPPDEDFFCVKPVRHSPNALNASQRPDRTGLRVLALGETLVGRIRLDIAMG